MSRSQGRSGRVQKISPPPGFDPRTVQPVASRYNDWAVPAHLCLDKNNENKLFSIFDNEVTEYWER
jgi:hypothetical protein